MVPKNSLRRTGQLAAIVAAGALALAACSSSGGNKATEDTTPDSTSSASGAALNADVAYLSASSANTWLQVSKAEMAKVAKANGVTITEFDGQFKSGEQSKQIQDVIAAGKYKGIVISAVDGAGSIPDLEAAIAKGIKVVVLNQVIGDKLDTADPQFAGASASVLAAPQRSGERLGQLAVQACEGNADCKVVYFYGIKGTPLDTALKAGFDATIKGHSNIKVVAEAEGKYLGPDVALKAMQDVIQRTPNFDVVIGSDQPIAGAEMALSDAGKLGNVKLIGLGGSKAAINGIKAGTWFGGVFGAPATEGTLAMDAMVAALRDGKVTGGIDPLTTLPDNGVITKANVDKFTAQWDG